MKTKQIVTLFMLLGLAMYSNAQGQVVPGGENRTDLKLGPSLAAGAATNAGNVASGWKTAPAFSWAPGGLLDYTFANNLGVQLGIAYDARTTNFHLLDNSNSGFDYNFGYLALRPQVRFDGFTLGLGIGFPVNVGTSGYGGSTVAPIQLSDLNTLVEARLGGTIELIKSETGTLNFTAEGSYAFYRNIRDAWFQGANVTMNNGPMASAELGLNYLFDLTPLGTPVPPVAAESPTR